MTMRRIPWMILCIFFGACTERISTEAHVQSDIVLETGTSFGECFGYCQRQLTITPSEITYRQASFNDLPTETYTLEYDPQRFDQLILLLDPVTFNQQPHVSGCPDCADGGAEWYRLTENGNVKEIVIEYGDSVDGLNEFLLAARSLRDSIYAMYDE